MLRLARNALPSRAPAATLSCLRQRAACFSAEASEAVGVGKKEEVQKFLGALKIDAKFAGKDKLGDMSTVLSQTKTRYLKKEGMTVKNRKELLTHIEKFKQGLWTHAPTK